MPKLPMLLLLVLLLNAPFFDGPILSCNLLSEHYLLGIELASSYKVYSKPSLSPNRWVVKK
jgi:hypothetical protein